MTIFGDGEQTRAFTYIADVAPLIARSVEVPQARNQVFNIGADTPYSVNELATRIAAAMGVERKVVHYPPRKEVVHAFSSHEKLRRVFGHTEPTPLDEGIRRMVEWAKRAGARKSRPFGAIEIEKNLPAAWRDVLA
jgi:UDP-glucose 4-epimerase